MSVILIAAMGALVSTVVIATQTPASVVATQVATSTPPVSGIEAPILVYHIVRPAFDTDSASVKKFAVTPEVFDEQMSYLQSAGYHVIPFSALEEYFYKGSKLPPNPVVITLDDAWEDQYVYALPVLVRHHYTATFFVPTNWIGARSSFLTWDQLKEMLSLGMTVESHSRSHPYLAKVTDPNVLASEIAESKKILEQHLGTTTGEFNYPFGSFTTTTIAAVKAAGYKAARSERFGSWQTPDDLFALRAINVPESMAQFKRFLPSHAK